MCCVGCRRARLMPFCFPVTIWCKAMSVAARTEWAGHTVDPNRSHGRPDRGETRRVNARRGKEDKFWSERRRHNGHVITSAWHGSKDCKDRTARHNWRCLAARVVKRYRTRDGADKKIKSTRRIQDKDNEQEARTTNSVFMNNNLYNVPFYRLCARAAAGHGAPGPVRASWRRRGRSGGVAVAFPFYGVG